MNIIGRLCVARYQGTYVIGTIIRIDPKNGLCDVSTEKYGEVTVRSARVSLVRDE